MTKLKTYRDLLEKLQSLDESQLDSDLTVYDAKQDEYYGVKVVVSEETGTDVLDKNHPIIHLETTLGEEISISS